MLYEVITPKTKEVLKRAMGGVLFIDEAYYLYRPENERDYGQEAIEILLQVMENQRDDLEESAEINACSIFIDVNVRDDEGKTVGTEPWLLMFKNETHNHPTEIEPFGGAATCIGGAIRDPLSSYNFV